MAKKILFRLKFAPDVAAAPEDPASDVLVTGHQGAGEAGDGGPGLAAVVMFVIELCIFHDTCHLFIR